MNTFPSLTSLELPARRLHSMRGLAGHQVTCQEGCLWLTLDDDTRDIILEPGQSFTLPDARRAVVYAFQRSRMTVRALPVPVTAPARSSGAAQVPGFGARERLDAVA